MGAPSLAIQVLGDELDVESLPSCTISPHRLLLLAGHDLKEHSHSGGLILHIMAICVGCHQDAKDARKVQNFDESRTSFPSG